MAVCMSLSLSPLRLGLSATIWHAIYSHMHVLYFEADRSPYPYSLLQLRDMLFADAVGCSKGTSLEIASLLDVCVRPVLTVVELDRNGSNSDSNEAAEAGAPTTAAATAALELNKVYITTIGSQIMRLWERQNGTSTVVPDFAMGEQQFVKKVTEQLESLLHVALKMDLQQLQARLLRSVHNNIACVTAGWAGPRMRCVQPLGDDGSSQQQV